ncbi:Mechanosensitive channel MscK [Acaryochloris thomasi RCC1774]|uniref:Mechanosensitive channel MscK n=1 Tax=Acaryochloris thomasi RCC1774 TaxID=1764569 RepID=A0A2W1JZ38_9CYAN|nr:mechanosensitive ion channel family protein [Acaryochloris thomasi]PZD75212.1 Mechanosensitive channel MscK [Acaryochloris thomasi RCC1774]
MSIFIYSLPLAQSTSNTANQTAEKAKDILAQITAGKVTRALLIVLAAYLAIQIFDKLIIWLSERVPREWRLRVKQFLPFVRLVVILVATASLIDLFLNINRENLLAITGTAAVALGFAFKDLVSSVIAGVFGLFEAPYRIGDRVQIGDHYGEVIGYGLRGIRLQTPDDSVVTIPHGQIWTSAVVNSNMGNLEAQVVTEFYFAHEVDVVLAKKILYKVAYTSKYTQLKLPVQVIMQEKSWGTLFKLKCYPIDARNEFVYKTDLISRAKQAFARHQLPYPRLLDLESRAQHTSTSN